jgi:hypothetical protein
LADFLSKVMKKSYFTRFAALKGIDYLSF